MPEIHATSSTVIAAPAPIVYGILADYHHGHPSILPPKYFQHLQVEEGGVGTGTRISFEMRSFGTRRRFHAHVTEPEPGRQLRETYSEAGMATTFTVEPVNGGRHARVTIATRYMKAGPAGWVERWVAPRFLRAVYAAELRELALQVQTRASRPAPA